MSIPTIAAPGIDSDKEFEAWFFDADQISGAWPELEELLYPAWKKSRGEVSMEDLRMLLEAGRVQAMCTVRHGAMELALVTEFVQYPQYKSVRIMFLGGKNLARASQKFLPAFIQWALANGAVEIEGWAPEKILTCFYNMLGFETVYTVNRMNLRGKLQ